MKDQLQKRGGSMPARVLGFTAGMLAVLLLATPSRSELADAVLFTTSAYSPPNVMFMIDTSSSMRTVIYHENYTVGDSSDCTPYSGGNGEWVTNAGGPVTLSNCAKGGNPARLVTIYPDEDLVDYTINPTDYGTWYPGDYLNWLFDSARQSDGVLTDIAAAHDQKYTCLEDASGDPLTYSKYRRSRMTAAKYAIAEVICTTDRNNKLDPANDTPVRFGFSRLLKKTGSFVVVPADDFDNDDGTENSYELDVSTLTYGVNNGTDPDANTAGVTRTHREHLTAELANLQARGNSPLDYGLTHTYLYYLDRDEAFTPNTLELDPDTNPDVYYTCEVCDKWGACEMSDTCIRVSAISASTTAFPNYTYYSSNGYDIDAMGDATDAWRVPDPPIENVCQKHYVVMLTDGDETNETATDTGGSQSPGKRSKIFSSAQITIAEIAGAMNVIDMYPDAKHPSLPGKQNISTYVVGYNVEDPDFEDLLNDTAEKGGGRFFNTADAEELLENLESVVAEIIEGAQSFAAASVPSSRQTLGSHFYTSFFEPKQDDPFWEGHLMSLNMSLGGGVFDKNWECALSDSDDPVACRDGAMMLDELNLAGDTGVSSSDPFYRVPVFDSARMISPPDSRDLYVGKPSDFGTTASQFPKFEFGASATTVSADDLGVAGLDAKDYLDNMLGHFSANPDYIPKTVGAGVSETPFVESLTTDGSNDTSKTDPDKLAAELISFARGCLLGSVSVLADCEVRKDDYGRDKLLGDIFHSAPLLVIAPNAFGLGEAYSKFRSSVKWRDLMVYAGANDGFLHAFNAGSWECTPGPCASNEKPDAFVPNGAEVFGFMPWTARKNINQLPLNTGSDKTYYVDGSATFADVWINRNDDGSGRPYASRITGAPTKEAYQWRTVVIGGMRSGGKSYYALDVTDPASSDFPAYLWEFPCEIDTGCENDGTALYDSLNIPITDAEGLRLDEYLGETWSDPVIRQIKVKSGLSDEIVARWVVIFGGGYSTESDPRSPGYSALSREGRGIFVVDIATGEILASRRFDPNGVLGNVGDKRLEFAFTSAAFVDDANGDGFSDTIYIGDLGGNIWRWDISEPGYDVYSNEGQPDWPLDLIFEASTGSEILSFYFPPVVAIAGDSGERWLIAATGNRGNLDEDMGDTSTDADNDRLYVIRDITNAALDSVIPLAENDLENMTDISIARPVGATDAEYLTLIEANQGLAAAVISSSQGYYLIAEDGEKFVSKIVVLNGQAVVGSFIPTVDPDSCVKSGEAYYYQFDLASSYPTHMDPSLGPDEARKKFVGIGMPKDPRPSEQGKFDETVCNQTPRGPCCDPPAGGWDSCHETCGTGALVLGGSSSGGSSSDFAGCTSPFLPRLRSWREE